ncbi:hypothetical protein DEO72_LG2g3315 [Vigna unguiculata]|uniref:Uncharacterized protein n=1 Tax=Vigna unguiculata TaxID=3917 RepID=A0A4D6L397_VIGUN|nr:hypothetical protein DEO72_LG2g3315 [Vigna unguiculata]
MDAICVVLVRGKNMVVGCVVDASVEEDGGAVALPLLLRHEDCDGAAAGMKLRDVATFVCLLRRVSGTEDRGGSRKVQGCRRDPWWLL